MPGITPEAQDLILTYNLGNIVHVYKPSMIGTIIFGCIVTAFATAWIIGAGVVTQSFSQFTHMGDLLGPGTFLPILVSICFPAFGLIFVVVGVAVISSALRNRHARIVSCVHGMLL